MNKDYQEMLNYQQKNSKVKIYKIETAEELVIARDTYKLTK